MNPPAVPAGGFFLVAGQVVNTLTVVLD